MPEPIDNGVTAVKPLIPAQPRGNPKYRYLQDNRLQRVIAALTVLGPSHEYRQSAPEWVYRLTGGKSADQTPENSGMEGCVP
jgi:hypothetical protein